MIEICFPWTVLSLLAGEAQMQMEDASQLSLKRIEVFLELKKLKHEVNYKLLNIGISKYLKAQLSPHLGYFFFSYLWMSLCLRGELI